MLRWCPVCGCGARFQCALPEFLGKGCSSQERDYFVWKVVEKFAEENKWETSRPYSRFLTFILANSLSLLVEKFSLFINRDQVVDCKQH